MTQPPARRPSVYYRAVDEGFELQEGLFKGVVLRYTRELFGDQDYVTGLFIGRAQCVEQHLLDYLRHPAAKASLSTRDATFTAISEPGRTLTLSLHRRAHDPHTFDAELRADGNVAYAGFFDTSELSLHQGAMAVAAQMVLAECCEYAQMLAWPGAYDPGDLSSGLYQLCPEEHQRVLASLASRPGDTGRSELAALYTSLEEVDWILDPARRLAQIQPQQD